MHPLAIAWHGLWFAQAGLYPALLVQLFRCRLQRDFPVFCAYVGYSSLHVTAQLAMNYAPWVSGAEYYAVDAVSSVILALLSLAVINELFRRSFSVHRSLEKLGSKTFRWGIVVLIAVAIALAWSAPASGAGHIMSVFYLLKRTLSLLLCGLVLLLLAGFRYLKLPWRSYSFGIAVGFGILACANLAAYAIRSQIEPIYRNASTDVLDVITEGAALSSVLVWMAYLFAAERQPPSSVTGLPKHDLETWNQELERLLHQ